MNTNLIFLTISILMTLSVSLINGDGKLKIGVKKRVENCTIKTKKGDLIHIHYTV